MHAIQAIKCQQSRLLQQTYTCRLCGYEHHTRIIRPHAHRLEQV